eukprot:6677-Heterococcus_DN1.PRE.1
MPACLLCEAHFTCAANADNINTCCAATRRADASDAGSNSSPSPSPIRTADILAATAAASTAATAAVSAATKHISSTASDSGASSAAKHTSHGNRRSSSYAYLRFSAENIGPSTLQRASAERRLLS